ncbi:hypothetical protein BCR41DRAFT_395679 [Lobosporangium transversale]|uniref:ER membrane protein complex subunit 7 beta-sandwich domain-containing protein n=1 Tax=Lobosporangium transversale TaxID=64571 RepID=A0A1Y2GRF6_9FUNG|nr:hypothetical protein BCR41DRAFT_395679 [Lobosporangium transversale]ORZ18426.1 hypothetical protein BCR41DRAFT_395679 [Lobosporangium transversale]|eukprot:XP_021882221.1 hypothetical protein BCR41DRAFT_395679 [Lobosporangium transversale]
MLSLAASVVRAAQLSGIVVGPTEHFQPRDLSPRTRVILSGGEHTAMVMKDGRFTFPNVPEGSYLLQVESPQYLYPTIKVHVTEKESRAYMVSLGADWSNNDNSLQFPLTLAPRAAASYFIPREGFKLSHLFANPMMLMMGFSVLMLFLMPKLMANMDPEAMQEMQGMQDAAQMPNFEMPDIAATLAKFSTGNSGSSSPASAKKKQ